MAPRGKNVKLYDMLADIVKSGSDKGKTPSAVKATRNEFKDVKPSTFRSWLCTLREEVQKRKLDHDDDDDRDGLHTICTNNDVKRAKVLSAHNDHDVDVDDVDDSESDEEAPVQNLDNDFVFKPIFVLGEWETKEEDKRISIAILMPSGACERPADHDVKVVRGGRFLEVSVVWPQSMTDMLLLHKTWAYKEMRFAGNVRIAGFRSFLRRLRSTTAEYIVSSYQIKLPFAVKTEISIVKRSRAYLRWVGSTQRVLYVTLKAPDSERNIEVDGVPTFIEA